MAGNMEVGDYDLRGPDFETLLVGPVTEAIIDADRVVRSEWGNGFPNWAMYRCALAGDTHLLADMRLWCVAIAVAYSDTGGLRAASDDAAVCAGRDACAALLTGRWGAPSDELAGVLGIAPKTYRRFRNAVYSRLKASLTEYWVRMQIAMRQVALAEKRADAVAARGRWSDGRGFDEVDTAGDGNYWAMPKRTH